MEKKLTVIPPSQTNGNAKSANSSQCRVAAYCRVSTEQEEQLGSFANQIAYYTDYINEKEDSVRVYQIKGTGNVTTWGPKDDYNVDDIIIV